MHRTSAISVSPITLDNTASSALDALFKQHSEKVFFKPGSYILRNGKHVKLQDPLFAWEKSIPALGLNIKKYEAVSTEFLGKGAFGSVFVAIGTFKPTTNGIEFVTPTHQRVVKVVSLAPEYSKWIPDHQQHFSKLPIFRKEAYKKHRKEVYHETNLMFKRAKYTHAKKVLQDEKNGYADEIVMISRRLPGKLLEKQCHSLTALERVSVAVQMLKGYVTQIEDNRIIHCDIKPGNFLFEKETRRGKHFDFGLSQKTEDSNQQYDAGSPLYFAFEVIRERKIGKKSDYFALGRSLQELFGDGAVTDINDSDINQEIFDEEMTALYNSLENGTQLVSRQTDYEELIWNYYSLDFLFKEYGLEFTLPDSYQQEIKNVIASLLRHRVNDRPDSLDQAIWDMMLIQMKLKHNVTSDEKVSTIIQDSCRVAFETFQALRHRTFDDVLAMKKTLLNGVDQLPNHEISLSVYIDFLELDQKIEISKNKEDISLAISALFDLYIKNHGKLIEYLQLVSRLISERQEKNLPPSTMLSELFSDIYNQLSRKESNACDFSAIADLAQSWDKKLPKIENKLKTVTEYNPANAMQVDSSCALQPFDVSQRKILNRGLIFLRSVANEETIHFLNQYRHYAALILQNCFNQSNENARFFLNELVPCIQLFAEIKSHYKKLHENAPANALAMSKLIHAIVTYATESVLKPIIEKSTTSHAKVLSDIQLALKAMNESTTDAECAENLRPLMSQLTPTFSNIVMHAFGQLMPISMRSLMSDAIHNPINRVSVR